MGCIGFHDYHGQREVRNCRSGTEGAGIEEGNHIYSSAVRGVALFLHRSSVWSIVRSAAQGMFYRISSCIPI